MWLKMQTNAKNKPPLWGNFQKSETEFKSMCRSVMASSFQKWS